MSFPAPSDFSVDTSLDLNQLVKKPPSTFFLRVSGDDLEDECVHSGDLLIVDRSLDPLHGCLVVAVMEGEFFIRRLHQIEGVLRIKQPGSDSYYAGEYDIWGVVATVIHSAYPG